MTAQRTAADDERAARRAFREFVRTNHPDRGGDPAVFAAGVAAHRARQGSTRAGSEVVFVRRRRGLRILTGWWRDRRATRRSRAPRVN